MAAHLGVLWSYRIGVIKGGGRVQLGVWELEGPIPSAMEVLDGNAPDAYGAMQTFTKQTKILLLQVWDNPGVFQLSADGSTYEDEVEVDPDKNLGSWYHRYAARGFRVKNKTGAAVARYQVIPFW